MIRSLDTSILVRLCINDIPEQVDAATALLVSGKTFHVADIAVCETVYVLESFYGLARPQVVKTVDMLLAQPNLIMNRQLFAEVLPHYIAHPKLSFIDCCLAVYAKLNEAAPLLTFDKKLANQLQHAELLQASA